MYNDLKIASLSSLHPNEMRQYGAKAANLGGLASIGMAIPPGVALGRDVLAYYLRENGIDLVALERTHSMGMVFFESAVTEAQEHQARIIEAVTTGAFPQSIVDKINETITPLMAHPLAVRSSCVVEDAAMSSFAGQYATVLEVRGLDAVLAAIRTCWASQYNGRVLKYAISRRGLPVLVPSMAVLIQRMLIPDHAGVCFTDGPTPKTRNVSVVESVPGLGEQLVSGARTPHYFEINTDGILDVRFHESCHIGGIPLDPTDSHIGRVSPRRSEGEVMAAWRRAIELSLGDEDTAKLRSIAQSRTEPASRVERARILLAYREDPSFYAVARALGLHHQTVQRCVERAVVEGALAALDDRPRPGREPTITPEAKAWLVSLACRKAKDLGYPHELWTTRLLARHAREHGPAEGHACLADLVQGTVCKILDQDEIKPHKVRYYLEQRDPDFGDKMAEVLCVYRQVQILKQAATAKINRRDTVAIISYDEKPGIQAIATTAPDLPPEAGLHPSFAREHEYKRHGTVSLLAGIDLVTGKVHALVKDRHRSREFIEFLKLLDAAYPTHTAIKLILDNHSAHISKETRAWLAAQPGHRFEFTFTPKHGSWLNLIEGFFSKLARSVLRHIRVASKQELKDRIMAAMDFFNQEPVVHTWTYKLDTAA